MSATLFESPNEIPVPTLTTYDGAAIDHYHKECAAYISAVSAWCRANTKSKSDLVGMLYRFPYADGYAQYVVLNTKPLQLVHLNCGDGWHMPDVVRRGLKLSDIKAGARRVNS